MKKRLVHRKTESKASRDQKRLVKRRTKDSLRKKTGIKHKKTPPDSKKGKCWWLKEYQWKPGQTGNPKGRPPNKSCITSLMKTYLKEVADRKTGKTYEALAAEALIHGLIKLNPTAIKEVMGRVEGAIKQMLEVEGHSSMDISLGELARRLAKVKGKKKK